METIASEKLILIREENRIEVEKDKLANKSRYFASLFSHNFNDSRNKEHVINYDVSLSTLQNFVEWIHDDKECTENNFHFIKTSLIKFVDQDFLELLNLLQLSVLFTVDSLIDDLIEIIVLHWLSPEKVIDIWLLAQELGINVLRDICFSVCLDRFDELPLSSIIELSKDNIVQLIGNVNVRSSTRHLHFVRNEWMQHHMITDIVNIKPDRRPKFIQGMLMYKFNEYLAKDAYVYTWDGVNLSECVQLKNIENSQRGIVGMQVTGRGFSIYMVGGEMGIGTGHFNKEIWRYCLTSKKWYYQAKLPIPRRHMIAAFIKNKLVIAGGVGRHRLKLSTVNVLNIHTGEWTGGAKVPECFTEVPPHCVKDGKLFLIKSAVYIYYLDQNYWETLLIYNNPMVQRVDAFLPYKETLFATGNHLTEMVLSRIEMTKESVCEREECLKPYTEHSIINNVNIVHEDESCQLRYTIVADIGIMLLNSRHDACEDASLHLLTEMRRDLGNSIFNPRLGYFKVITSEHLYDTV